MAIVLLVVLHRRHVTKLRSEDNDDKHRSLDFGMSDVEASRAAKKNKKDKKNKNADMVERPHRMTGKGMSLDLSNPYLMPPEMHASRESLHSMSRSLHSNDDKFHYPASSLRPPAPHDDASSFAGSSADVPAHDDMDESLLGNAQRMSRSSPPIVQENMPQDNGPPQLDWPMATSPGLMPTEPNDKRYSHNFNGYDTTDFRRSNDYLGTMFQNENHSADNNKNNNVEFVVEDYSNTSDFPLPPSVSAQRASVNAGRGPAQAPSVQPPRISLPLSDDGSDFSGERNDGAYGPAADKTHGEAADQETRRAAEPNEQPSTLSMYGMEEKRDTRRMTFGLRPLPPEDPTEDPEQRANRIRSFYKEYFDQSHHRPMTGEFYEDYPIEFNGYDPVTGEPMGVPAPFAADPYGRRAMTPPPRAPPKMAYGSGSTGVDLPSPRVFSSASGRFPGPNMPPKKRAPPPGPLKVLPTPHMLNDDAFTQSIEFAPGRNMRDRREGRPDTPTGGLRPYSPTTRAVTPLISPFDELTAVPSA